MLTRLLALALAAGLLAGVSLPTQKPSVPPSAVEVDEANGASDGVSDTVILTVNAPGQIDAPRSYSPDPGGGEYERPSERDPLAGLGQKQHDDMVRLVASANSRE